MRQKCGAIGFKTVRASYLIATFAAVFTIMAESSADARFLEQGARPSSGDRIKTLRPPAPGTRDRIRAPGETRATAPSVRARKQNHAWFWKIHEPSAVADARKWGRALASLRERRAAGKAVFDADSLISIRQNFGAQIATAAAKHNVSETVLLAVIAVESRGRAQAVSPKGAQGLMQLIPATARRFGVTNAFDAGQNISGGAAYLNWLLKEFRGDPVLALAGYNAGEGSVRKYKGVPPFAETRDYVVKVLDAIVAISHMCAQPLETPRSACRWKGES